MDELFSNISQKDKEKLLKLLEATTVKCKKNSTILTNISKENLICIVKQGNIHIVKSDAEGNQVIIGEYKNNEMFGTTFSHLQSSYEIIPKEDSIITIIDIKNIVSLDENKIPYYTEFLKNIIKIVISKNNEMEKRMEILTNRTTRDKLLTYFNMLSKKLGSRIIYLPFNYSELSDYLAVNRSAMTRELKNMKEEKIIETKGKRIKLLYYYE